MFFCARNRFEKKGAPHQASRAKGPASRPLPSRAGARRQAPRQPPPLPGRVPAGLRSVSPSPFLCFVFFFLFLVYFLSPTPSLLSPHLYKYPHTPPPKHQIKPQAPHHPAPPQAAPHPAPLTRRRRPYSAAAAALARRRRHRSPRLAGGSPAPLFFFPAVRFF